MAREDKRIEEKTPCGDPNEMNEVRTVEAPKKRRRRKKGEPPEPPKVGHLCKYNKKNLEIACTSNNDDDCQRCGWNPYFMTAEKRIEVYQKAFYERNKKIGGDQIEGIC